MQQRIYFKKIFSENYTCILTTSHELIPLMARSFAVSEDKIKGLGTAAKRWTVPKKVTAVKF